MGTASQFTTIRTADILDQLCDAVDTAREAAAGNTRWLNAISTAWGYLLTTDTIQFDASEHAIRVESATDARTVYIANGDCSCRAFAEGNACWHRAAARLVRRALERKGAAQAAPAPMDDERFAWLMDQMQRRYSWTASECAELTTLRGTNSSDSPRFRALIRAIPAIA
jgi:hypothetical protein